MKKQPKTLNYGRRKGAAFAGAAHSLGRRGAALLFAILMVSSFALPTFAQEPAPEVAGEELISSVQPDSGVPPEESPSSSDGNDMSSSVAGIPPDSGHGEDPDSGAASQAESLPVEAEEEDSQADGTGIEPEAVEEQEEEAQAEETQDGSAFLGVIWADENENGLQDLGERGVNNLTVLLQRQNEADGSWSKVDSGVTSPLGEEQGVFAFTGLEAANYRVVLQLEEEEQQLYTPTTGTVQLAEGFEGVEEALEEETVPVTPIELDETEIPAGEVAEDSLTTGAALLDGANGAWAEIGIAPMAATSGYVVTRDDTHVIVGAASYNTLQEAVNACLTTTPCTITLVKDDTSMGNMVSIAGKSITIKSLNIAGAPFTIKQDVNQRHITLQANGRLTLENITLAGNGYTTDPADLTSTNPLVINGGISLATATSALVLNDGGVIENCYSGYWETVNNPTSNAIVQALAGTITIDGGSVKNNVARNVKGGGIYSAGTVDMFSGEICNNQYIDWLEPTRGGGIYADSGSTLNITGGEIYENGAEYGGGIYANEADVTLKDVDIHDNYANRYGGGIYYTRAKQAAITHQLTILEGTKIRDNEATNRGGGLYFNSPYNAAGSYPTRDVVECTLAYGLFEGNRAGYGAGIYTTGNLSLAAAQDDDLIIKGNVSARGGGGVHSDKASLFLVNAQITGNQTTLNGGAGGIYITGEDRTVPLLSMSGGKVSGNTLETIGVGGAGGILVDGADFVLTGGEITGNSYTGAENYIDPTGGGVAFGSIIQLMDSTITTEFTMTGGKINDNTTTMSGGGIDFSGQEAGNGMAITISGGEICGNTAGFQGGGVHFNTNQWNQGIMLGGDRHFVMTGGKISGNTAPSGGGIYYRAPSTLPGYIDGSFQLKSSGGSKPEISHNTATGDGGGIYHQLNSYANPANLSYYHKMGIEDAEMVHSNTSQRQYAPPSNAADFNTRPGDLTFPGELLNNDQINYHPPEMKIMYDAGHSNPSQPRVTQQTDIGLTEASGTVTLYDNDTTNFVPPAGNPTYVFLGWNTGYTGNGTSYAGGEVATFTPPKNLTLYAQWGPPPADTTVTVSKQVTGKFADLTKHFTFTLTLWDGTDSPMANEPLPYTVNTGTTSVNGGAQAASGTLTLDAGGKATFTLGHGQSITFGDIPTDGHMQVEEQTDGQYKASHTASGTGYTFAKTPTDADPGDTGKQPMACSPLTVAYTNERIYVAPTGVAEGGKGLGLLGPMAILALLPAMGLVRRKRRRQGGMP